jgi:hypothetical protein
MSSIRPSRFGLPSVEIAGAADDQAPLLLFPFTPTSPITLIRHQPSNLLGVPNN